MREITAVWLIKRLVKKDSLDRVNLVVTLRASFFIDLWQNWQGLVAISAQDEVVAGLQNDLSLGVQAPHAIN